MSWSFSIGATHAAHVPERLHEKANEEIAKLTHAVDEATEQIDLAVKVVEAIVASKAVGNENREFGISCSGHANHQHHRAANWGPDYVTVTVTQVQ